MYFDRVFLSFHCVCETCYIVTRLNTIVNESTGKFELNCKYSKLTGSRSTRTEFTFSLVWMVFCHQFKKNNYIQVYSLNSERSKYSISMISWHLKQDTFRHVMLSILASFWMHFTVEIVISEQWSWKVAWFLKEHYCPARNHTTLHDHVLLVIFSTVYWLL